MVRRQLRPVAAVPERALGMIRVSKERDGMVSPEVQRAAISDYATARGYDVVGWLEGLDESGSRARSAWWPRLDQAVAEVEAGEYDVIVVWKFSRTARHRRRWAVALDRVESAGGRLESATEQVDVTTSTGRFTRGMLAELNAFEAERIGEVWKEVHDRRIRSGRPATGKPKWGYAYDSTRQLHVPDPETGPVLADLYRRYVAGESVYGLVRWLNARGHRTLTGGLWSERTLRRVLDSGFGAGKFKALGEIHDGVHEPVIGPDLWQAYLDSRAGRRGPQALRERSQYLLSGLVRCARCGGAMVAGQNGTNHQPKYRCKTGKEVGPEVCPGGYITARFVEDEVVAWLTGLAAEVDVGRRAALEAKAHRRTATSDVTRLTRQIDATEAAYSRFALQHAEQPMPKTVYADGVRKLQATLDELQQALDDAQRATRTTPTAPRAAARALLDGWDAKPVAMRRAELAAMIRRVDVLTGRPRGVVTIVPAWTP